MNNPVHQIQDIHRLMERSSRFIGLSGLSGVGAGCFALLGALLARWYLHAGQLGGYSETLSSWPLSTDHPWGWTALEFFALDGIFVLTGALGCAIYFTTRRARQKGQATWDALTKRLLWSLAIPLMAGGLFCLALLYHQLAVFVAPATLIFYGLALVNASKHTYQELYYLGLCEIALGLIGTFFIGSGLLLWAIGFGLLHILYGISMYRKYELTE